MKRLIIAVLFLILIASSAPGPYIAATRVTTSSAVLPASLGAPFRSTIETSCGDCHSNATAWPWYSKIAPVSWMIRKDVSEGRSFLNFSRWEQYGETGQMQLLQLAADEIQKGAMPPARYLLLHPEAKLSAAQRVELSKALLYRTPGDRTPGDRTPEGHPR